MAVAPRSRKDTTLTTSVSFRSPHAEDNGYQARAGFHAFRCDDAESTIPARFGEVARRRGDAVALVDGDYRTSYRALLERSAVIAGHLRERLGTATGPVAVLMPFGARAVEFMLGILLAGRSYLTLEPSSPDSEIAKVLAAGAAAAILGDFALRPRLAAISPAVERLLVPVDALFGQARSGIVADGTTPSETACIFATSGSTGEPKLVALSHRAVLFDIGRQTNDLYLGADDRFDLLFSFAFSASLAPIFSALLNGGELHLLDLRERLLDLPAWLQRSRITISTMTVSTLRSLCASLRGPGACPNLRLLSVGGEPLLPGDVESFRSVFAPSCVLQNAMAATETRTYAQYFVPRTGQIEDPVPVGWPVQGKQVFLLGDDAMPVREGEAGEIAVRSRFVASGYANDPARTSERFFPQSDGTVIYRTGDRGRFQSDGCLVFLGRADQQVKLRGYRIELGEIEATLGQHPQVRQAVVLLWEDRPGDKRLVAYVVPRGETGPAPAELRHFLDHRLPAYMLPSAFVFLERLPLTPNAKVDRRALPPPAYDRPQMRQAYEPPRTPTEAVLVEIWGDVLKLQQVGIYDNFFEFGGHSLLATQLVSQIRRRLNVEVPLRTIFDMPTIESLGLYILEQQAEASNPAELEELITELESISDESAASQLLEVEEEAASSPSLVVGKTADVRTRGFGCPSTKSDRFGKRKCNLVIVLNEIFESASFERVAGYVREFDPSIDALVVGDHPSVNLSLTPQPTLIFCPALVRHRLPLQGRIFCGSPLSKSQEYTCLEKIGVPVPKWVLLTQDEIPDLSAFDDYVVRKPDQGGFGAEVTIVRKSRVRWKPITTRVAGTSSATIIQQFIYTGPRPVSCRVNTLFGQVLYSLRFEASADRRELAGPNDFRAAVRQHGVSQDGVSIVANARGSRVELNYDEEIIHFAELAHAAFPEIPLLGFDIVREVPSGKLYMLEANAIGYVWHFTSHQPAHFGFSLEEQFDGVRKAAYILAEKTQQYAR
jgi:amino acid adenylation domain-containing protein